MKMIVVESRSDENKDQCVRVVEFDVEFQPVLQLQQQHQREESSANRMGL